MIIKNLSVPFFHGFYGTVFDCSETAYSEIESEIDYYKQEYNRLLTQNHFDFDYKGYQEKVVNEFMETYKSNYLLDIIDNIDNVRLISPKYYNYENDEIYAYFSLTDAWKEKMKKFMDDNYNVLKSIIKKHYSSYDGFISFMSNDIDEWYKMLFDFEPGVVDSRYLGEMIKYMTVFTYANRNINSLEDYRKAYEYIYDDIVSETLENTEAYQFVSLIDEKETCKV